MSDEDKTPVEPAEQPEVEPAEEPEVESEPQPQPEPEPAPEPEADAEPAEEPAAEPEPELASAEEPEPAPPFEFEPPAAASDATAVLPAIAAESSESAPRALDLGPERRSRWWVWVLVTVVILGIVGAGVYAWWFATNRPIVVPDVIGKTPAEATQVLNDVGLRLGEATQEPTDTAPAGTVIAQNPQAGGSEVVGSAVSLVVAAPSTQSKVPDVTGRTADEAAADLAKAQLAAEVVSSYSTTVAADFVVSQVPESGAQMPPGASVVLVVSKGPQPVTVTVPNLSRVTETEAKQMLAATELKGAMYRSFNASVPAGEVVTQSPVPGAKVAPNTTVQYLISQGAGTAPVTVPDVVGKTESNAKTAVKNKGLVAKTKTVPSQTVPKGQVISQMPPAGSTTANGGIVGLLVSGGNLAQAEVPKLSGLSSSEASKTITAAGFTPIVLNVSVSGETTGAVFAQYPAPGVPHPIPFPVIALVAQAPK